MKKTVFLIIFSVLVAFVANRVIKHLNAVEGKATAMNERTRVIEGAVQSTVQEVQPISVPLPTPTPIPVPPTTAPVTIRTEPAPETTEPAHMYAPSCVADNIPHLGRHMAPANDSNYRRPYAGLRVSWQYADKPKPRTFGMVCVTPGKTYQLPYGTVTIRPLKAGR